MYFGIKCGGEKCLKKLDILMKGWHIAKTLICGGALYSIILLHLTVNISFIVMQKTEL